MDVYQVLNLQSISYKVFSTYPDLKWPCDSAVDYLGFLFPGQNEPLLFEVLKNAFRAYENAEARNLDVRKEFVTGLCSLAHYLYKSRYVSSLNSDASVWTPMEMKISSFEKKHPQAFIINERDPQFINSKSASSLFAARILPGYLYAEFFKCECLDEEIS